MTEEMLLEEAVSRVARESAAESAPRVTRDEVRCLVESFRLTTDTAASRCPNLYGPARAASSAPYAWDEPEAVKAVLFLKANRGGELVDSSSAGQSTSASQVFEHYLRLAKEATPWGAS